MFEFSGRTVLNLLDACYDAICSVYEEPVTELNLRDEQRHALGELQCQADNEPATRDDDPDDDIPF